MAHTLCFYSNLNAFNIQHAFNLLYKKQKLMEGVLLKTGCLIAFDAMLRKAMNTKLTGKLNAVIHN